MPIGLNSSTGNLGPGIVTALEVVHFFDTQIMHQLSEITAQVSVITIDQHLWFILAF